MEHEEIIAMARDEGLSFVPDANSPLARIVRTAVAKEREACAQVCDAKAHEVRLWCNESNVIACAAAIRARGTKEGA